MTLRQHLEGEVHFQYFRDGELWYKTDSGLLFSVAARDTGTAAFNRDDRAILFMRWIRRWLTMVEAAGK